MGDRESRTAFLKKFAATSTVSISVAASGFLLAACAPPVMVVYVVNHVDPDTSDESTPPEVDAITQSEAAGEGVELVIDD